VSILLGSHSELALLINPPRGFGKTRNGTCQSSAIRTHYTILFAPTRARLPPPSCQLATTQFWQRKRAASIDIVRRSHLKTIHRKLCLHELVRESEIERRQGCCLSLCFIVKEYTTYCATVSTACGCELSLANSHLQKSSR
jgi:hypothetical protein